MPSAFRVSAVAVLWCACVGCSAGGANEPPPPLTPGSGSGGGSGAGSGSGSGAFDPGLAPTAETCGNSQLDEFEQCDDGNTDSADGCNALCMMEENYDCPTPGELCTSSSLCGDGQLSSAEACDDGNTAPDDGCAADCKLVDPGWLCRVPNKACVAWCGDGVIIQGHESCDDSNTVATDGCSSRCQVEPGWSCDTLPCTRSVCGNGVKEAGEACDAGTENGLFSGNSTGCSKTCTQEPSCRDSSGLTVACTPGCGSGNIDPGEACDDGNLVDGDGCSSVCAFEEGFVCTAETIPDSQVCSSGVGNCLVLPITYRDFDGQNQATSGHPDFFFMGANVGGTLTSCVPNASGITPGTNGTCWSTDSTPLCSGLAADTLGPGGKPTLGAVQTCACRFTDWDNTGVLAATAGVTTCNDSGGNSRQRIETTTQVIQSAESFAQWYSDSALSTKVVETLELTEIAGTNQFQFSSSQGKSVYDDIHTIFLTGTGTLSSGFFPLEAQARPKVCNIWPYWVASLATSCVAQSGSAVQWQWDPRGWGWLLPPGNVGTPPATPTGGPVSPVTGVPRNFYFTSEVRYLFRYVGGETLAFYGDDDVWVFINGKMVLDLGAPHERLQGTVTLTATGADWVIQSQNVVNGAWNNIKTGSVPGLGLEVDKTYEIAVFHADRHPRESNYQLTLSGFGTSRSVCQPECGNGIVTAGEECDDGVANQDGLYGGCTTTCTYGPFCGDGTTNGPEVCDLGRDNGPSYGADSCTTACTRSHFCGDGLIDSGFGEECDNGEDNGSGLCTKECKLELL